jgi:hypothetical protein
MRRLAAPAVLLALAISGCTQAPSSDTGDFSGEEGAVAKVVGDLSDAASRGETSTVCADLISAELQKAIAGVEEGDDAETSCQDEVEKAFDDADGFVVDVDEVTVNGDEATAQVSSEQLDGRVERTFSFVKEDGDWRIDSFG